MMARAGRTSGKEESFHNRPCLALPTTKRKPASVAITVWPVIGNCLGLSLVPNSAPRAFVPAANVQITDRVKQNDSPFMVVTQEENVPALRSRQDYSSSKASDLTNWLRNALAMLSSTLPM